MYKYFCDYCGRSFESSTPERDPLGLLNDIACPHCGSFDIFPDTPEGHAASVAALTEYENKTEIE